VPESTKYQIRNARTANANEPTSSVSSGDLASLSSRRARRTYRPFTRDSATPQTTIAIGHAASAAVSNDDGFWSLVDQASREAGDRVWRLPMYADYRILLRSQIADLRNAEYGEAGTIMGGMFIAEFAGGKPWAHIDIAASAWNTNTELTTILRGPSGAGTARGSQLPR